MVTTLPKSAWMATMVWATAGRIPLITQVDPSSAKPRTTRSRWLALRVSTTSTPVMDVQPTASVTYDEPKTLCCPKLD